MAKKLNLIELRDNCEQDLYTFMCYINPHYSYGDVHKELARFLMDDAKDEMVQLPRGHLKSHEAAMYCIWKITKNPCLTVGYCSATEELAIAQLDFIKKVLESDRYRLLWPQMINPESGHRDKWAARSIKVDHPLRIDRKIRDATVHAFGINSNTTGLHFDELIFDDIVVKDNAYTEDMRQKVASSHAQLSASVLNVGGITKTFGTRYHPKDLYGIMENTFEDEFNQDGEIINQTPVYKVFKKVVEQNGNFIWPKKWISDAKFYGFDQKELSKIKAKYAANGELTQFYAQYYNNPNDEENCVIERSKFQYYDKKHLSYSNNIWYYKEKRLNLMAAIDFAFTVKKTSDYTVIAIIAKDEDKYLYILDLIRFKTKNPEEYFERILKAHEQWRFRKIRMEMTAAQSIIVEYLRDRIREQGLSLSVMEFYPSRNQGTKAERIAAVLEPLYQNGSIWHYEGGYINLLEDELVMENPLHDDLKDAVASAIEICTSPSKNTFNKGYVNTLTFNSRFGGVG